MEGWRGGGHRELGACLFSSVHLCIQCAEAPPTSLGFSVCKREERRVQPLVRELGSHVC
jgi:hypothetical protein